MEGQRNAITSKKNYENGFRNQREKYKMNENVQILYKQIRIKKRFLIFFSCGLF